jgi:hypothetical protein
MKPSLGKFAQGGNATIDVPRLIETRMLIQAGSGFGKSWACRRLLEQTAGHVQQLVIDPEGEFATLREKHDYVIAAAHDADALAHPRTAPLLARRLLETGVSAILDIYDLKAHERHAFVKLFCQALVDAPKTLWQPVLVLLDEAHVYCPEQSESEAQGAVIDLATRGRKRGYGLVMATQRLSKLSKDAAAESFNKLIGRCQLDVDVKRAAAELGMTPKDALAVFRTMQPGDFFAFGPALCPNVQQLHVGAVETTHPKAGKRTLRAPPKPTAAIKAVLPKLKDLPREAEAEARTLADLKRELANARRELASAKHAGGGRPAAADLQAAEARGRERGQRETLAAAQRAGAASARELRGKLHQAIDSALAVKPTTAEITRLHDALTAQGAPLKGRKLLLAGEGAPRPSAPPPARRAPPPEGNGSGDVPKGEAAILRACIQFPEGLRRDQLTVLTGYKRSTRNAYIQRLAERGLVAVDGESVTVTDQGREAMPEAEPLPTGAELQAYWFERLPEGERKILQALVERHPEPVQRDVLTELTGYKQSTRNAYLQRLAAKELVAVASGGEVKASENLF